MQSSTSQLPPSNPPSRSSSSSSRRLPATWADSAPKRPAAPPSHDPWSAANHQKKKHKAATWKGKERADAGLADRAASRKSASDAGADHSRRKASESGPRPSIPSQKSTATAGARADTIDRKPSRNSQVPARAAPSAVANRAHLRVVPEIGTPPKRLPHPTRGPAPLEDLFGEDISAKPPSRSSSSAPTTAKNLNPSKQLNPSIPSASKLFVPYQKKAKPLFPKAIYSVGTKPPNRPISPARFLPVDAINQAVQKAALDVKARFGSVADRRMELQKKASTPPLPPPPVSVGGDRKRSLSPELFEGVRVPSSSGGHDDAEDADISDDAGAEIDANRKTGPASSSRSGTHSRSAVPDRLSRTSTTGKSERSGNQQPRRRFSFPLKEFGTVDGSGGEVVAIRRTTSSTGPASLERRTAVKTTKMQNSPATCSMSSSSSGVKGRKQSLGVPRSFTATKKGSEEDWYDIDCSGSAAAAHAPKLHAPPRKIQPSLLRTDDSVAGGDLRIAVDSLTLSHSTYAELSPVAAGRVVTILLEVATFEGGIGRLVWRSQREVLFYPTSYQDNPEQTGGLQRLATNETRPFSIRLDATIMANLASAALTISLVLPGFPHSETCPLDVLLSAKQGQLDLAEHGYLDFEVALQSPPPPRRERGGGVVQSSAEAANELATRVSRIALHEEHPDGVWIPDPVPIRGHAVPKEIILPWTVPGGMAFDFATRLPYKPGDPVPFLADETAESMRGFIREGDTIISRSTLPAKEKLIARMQLRWSSVNPYPYSYYLRELACWRYYAPVVHHFSVRLELALHLTERLLKHHLITEPELRTILHAYDEEVRRVEAGERDDYAAWVGGGGGPSQEARGKAG